jgi:hypothetical protein
MKARTLTRFLAVMFAAAASLTVLCAAGDAPLQVDPLKSNDVTSDGVSWVWFLPKSGSGKVTKVAELDMATNELVIRIDGELQRLMKRSETWNPERQTGPRAGDTCVEIWGNSTYVLELFYKQTKSEYEHSSFKGKMEVSLSSAAVRAGYAGSPAVLDVEGETGS